ncbi:hypothetical protein LSUE1_G006475 [Lachnellula suecica]|uniref:Uncharacterized protein n=1 Tax=Lachnellula suecica TaxID=602035 RepID=A0A8T9BWD5_9HELO|nr:hypothetical protein LSUE1_G006475 [Lachnellula suecica]
MVSQAKFPAMRAFYGKVLKPVGYQEMIPVSDSYVGFGSDYPYLWLRSLPDGTASVPTHLAIDAPDNKSVDDFHKLGIEGGGKDNGLPGIRGEMSVKPYSFI